MGLPTVWGARPEEMAVPYDCDRVVGRAVEGWFRAVTVRADAASMFRWLCQLRVAPYSYDLLDNYGRRSNLFMMHRQLLTLRTLAER
ncbi:hypothetical protein ACIBHX_06155 [Nonomuraea sp. NPDC050536]|uniref:hypothetical protein n=1 Tax=Nonomuraea sp. NPDC050536 TaxID=3364366 RepID=UPI0037CB5C2C